MASFKLSHLSSNCTLIYSTKNSYRFTLFNVPKNPIVLGYPWLTIHNPNIPWTEGELCQWSMLSTTTILQYSHWTLLTNNHLTTFPECYQDLSVAFSKTKASERPPHTQTMGLRHWSTARYYLSQEQSIPFTDTWNKGYGRIYWSTQDWFYTLYLSCCNRVFLSWEKAAIFNPLWMKSWKTSWIAMSPFTMIQQTVIFPLRVRTHLSSPPILTVSYFTPTVCQTRKMWIPQNHHLLPGPCS